MTARRRWFLHHISDVVGSADDQTEVLLPTTAARYIPCWVRMIGEPRGWAMTWRARICAAAYVLAGKAVALQWPRDGELELALFGPVPEPLRQTAHPHEEDVAGDAA